MTSAEIVAEFARREAEAGGFAKVDARDIAQAIAHDTRIPYEDVRDALLASWIAEPN